MHSSARCVPDSVWTTMKRRHGRSAGEPGFTVLSPFAEPRICRLPRLVFLEPAKSNERREGSGERDPLWVFITPRCLSGIFYFTLSETNYQNCESDGK